MGWQDAPEVDQPQQGGIASELGKGVGRGALGWPNFVVSAGDWLEEKFPTPSWMKTPDLGIRGTLSSANQALTPTPQTNLERMLGTGAEIAMGAAIPMGGPAMSLGKRALSIATPTIGGVVGEQLGGEMGKLAGTLASPFAQKGISRVLAPQGQPGTGEAIRELTKQGVRPTVGQTFGGLMKRFEGLPFVREFAASGQKRANEQFNRAVLNRALSPIGTSVDDIGTQGFTKAHELASKAYDDVLSNIRQVKFDFPFNQELMRVRNSALNSKVRSDLRGVYDSLVRPRWEAGQGVISAQEMKQIDSDLGEIARRFERSTVVKDSYVADGVRGMQEALRNLVSRQNPQYAAELTKANQAWSNLVRVEKAVVDASESGGIFTPRQLMKAVKSVDTTRRKAGVAMGRSPMQGIAQQGLDVLGEPTVQHLPYSMLVGGAGASLTNPYTLPLGVVAGGLLGAYNPATQAALPYFALRRPEAIQQLGLGMRPGTMRTGVTGAMPGLFGGEQ